MDSDEKEISDWKGIESGLDYIQEHLKEMDDSAAEKRAIKWPILVGRSMTIAILLPLLLIDIPIYIFQYLGYENGNLNAPRKGVVSRVPQLLCALLKILSQVPALGLIIAGFVVTYVPKVLATILGSVVDRVMPLEKKLPVSVRNSNSLEGGCVSAPSPSSACSPSKPGSHHTDSFMAQSISRNRLDGNNNARKNNP